MCGSLEVARELFHGAKLGLALGVSARIGDFFLRAPPSFWPPDRLCF